MTTTTKKKGVTKERLKKEFITHVLEHGKEPTSIFVFTKKLKVDESAFYQHFNSFDALEKTIWLQMFEKTVDALEGDEAYEQYSVREKWLALYFTWAEHLKDNRSYVLLKFGSFNKENLNPRYLGSLKDAFESFAKSLVAEGKESGEIAQRILSDKYYKGFWLHFLMITQFWSNDDSPEFSQTDAFIEKSVHFAMDTLASGPLESFFDLAKFVYQSKKPF